MKWSRQEIAAALQGWWREELLFELEACLDFYRLYESKIKECDQVIEQFLIKYVPETEVSADEQKQLKANRKKRNKHAPGFNLPQLAFRYFQTGLFAITGMSYAICYPLQTKVESLLFQDKKVGDILSAGERLVAGCLAWNEGKDCRASLAFQPALEAAKSAIINGMVEIIRNYNTSIALDHFSGILN